MVDRAWEKNASDSAPSAPSSPSMGYPTGGNPSQGIAATRPGAYWYHMVTEALRKVITYKGRTPDHTDLDQLSRAVHEHEDQNAAGTHYRVVVVDGYLATEEVT